MKKSDATSQVLSRLLDSRRYDSRLRPNYAGENCQLRFYFAIRQVLLFSDYSKIGQGLITDLLKYEMIISS